MKDNWLIEEVTISSRCRYIFTNYNNVDLCQHDYFAGFENKQECTKESCPIRVKGEYDEKRKENRN